MPTYCGIDPGTTGCVAVIRSNTDIQFWDAPTSQIRIGKKKRAVYDKSEMVRILRAVQACDPEVVVILEEVHAMPKTGSQGNFSSGFGSGLWQGVLTALQIPFTTVQPARWKKHLGIKRPEGETTDSGNKNMDRMVARQMFPAAAEQMSLVKHHGRADSLLLAEYGRQTQGALAPEKE